MPESTSSNDLGLSLALAVVETSNAPVLLLDDAQTVISASAAFCTAFEVDAATIVGKAFASLGEGEWAIPQLQSLLKATASGLAEVKNYEFVLKRTGRGTRSLVLNASKLKYGEGRATRILLAIADVTEAQIARRLNDDLLREKTALLQELQHRVANSLQIIASVLLQSAKKVQSEETRGHLRDAHNRVMSIAAMQRQLAVSSVDQVRLQPYFQQLCESIGASMIHDGDQIKLRIMSDASVVEADVSYCSGSRAISSHSGTIGQRSAC